MAHDHVAEPSEPVVLDPSPLASLAVPAGVEYVSVQVAPGAACAVADAFPPALTGLVTDKETAVPWVALAETEAEAADVAAAVEGLAALAFGVAEGVVAELLFAVVTAAVVEVESAVGLASDEQLVFRISVSVSPLSAQSRARRLLWFPFRVDRVR